jgi:CorA-like Mg2+ transporter protein
MGRLVLWTFRSDNCTMLTEFLAVILCDPPVEQVFVGHSNIDRFFGNQYSRSQPESPLPITAPNTPFSGGYLDFIKHPEFGADCLMGPPRKSMLEDLCFYWDKYGSHLVEKSGPGIATVFMQKIVASHYMQLLDFLRANISNLEYQLSRRDNLTGIQIPWIEERWSELQAWSRQLSLYVEDVEAIMISLGISFSAPYVPQSRITDWTSCDRDLQYIHYRLKALKARVDTVSNSITGLAGIAGNRQALLEAKRSLKEAKGIRTLTFLGMVFIPLAFCAGLFSMNDQYLPGTASFWIYIAVSVPLVAAVFLAAFLIGLGYDSDGEWNLETFIQALPVGEWIKLRWYAYLRRTYEG